MAEKYTLEMDETDRQMVLLALAHLSIQRPGWDYTLTQIAARIDKTNSAGRPELYDGFRDLRAEPSGEERAARLYLLMSTDDLRSLRTAFLLDREASDNHVSIAFAAGRLALIAAELGRRGEHP